MTSFEEAKRVLRSIQLTLTRSTEDEFRVNFIGGEPTTAYYTNDLDDAIATGHFMRNRTMPSALTTLYLVHFATTEDFECAMDDGISRLWDEVPDMASPVGFVTTDLDIIAEEFRQETLELMNDPDEADARGGDIALHWVKHSDTQWNLMQGSGMPEDFVGCMIIKVVGTCNNFKEAK